MSYEVITGDVTDVCKELDSESFDAVLSDPPYGISFMGNGWDHGVPNADVWREIYRVCRPGAYLMAFGGTRTFHRLVCEIEDAGFDIRDCLMYLFGSGFPKNHNISKAIDKAAGKTRAIAGVSESCRLNSKLQNGGGFDGLQGVPYKKSGTKRNSMNSDFAGVYYETLPATDSAALWEGFGTALKPAYEPVTLARRGHTGPIYRNCLENGCGALNIDAGRIGSEEITINTFDDGAKPFGNGAGHEYTTRKQTGRWPSNLILSHSIECKCIGEEVVPGHKGYPNGPGGKSFQYSSDARSADVRPDAWEGIPDSTVEKYECVEGCPVDGLHDKARYFYSAKASVKEKHAGLDGRNPHPTCKPIQLCKYLAGLLLPPPKADGTPRRILVPFSGSGSEMVGCLLAGWDEVVGIEISSDYATVARNRLSYWARGEKIQGNLF